jgi:hypothetical protein
MVAGMSSPIVARLPSEVRELIGTVLQEADAVERPDDEAGDEAVSAWVTTMAEKLTPVVELLRSRGAALDLDHPALRGSAAAYMVATMMAGTPVRVAPGCARMARRPRPRGAGRPGRRRVARRRGDSGDSDSDDPEPADGRRLADTPDGGAA